MKKMMRIPAVLTALVILYIMAAHAAEPPDIYIFNKPYLGTVSEKGGEVWVSLTDVLPLMKVGWTVGGDILDMNGSGEKKGGLLEDVSFFSRPLELEPEFSNLFIICHHRRPRVPKPPVSSDPREPTGGGRTNVWVDRRCA